MFHVFEIPLLLLKWIRRNQCGNIAYVIPKGTIPTRSMKAHIFLGFKGLGCKVRYLHTKYAASSYNSLKLDVTQLCYEAFAFLFERTLEVKFGICVSGNGSSAYASSMSCWDYQITAKPY